MAKNKPAKIVNPLFAHTSPGVQALAKEAAKNIRAQERAEWWAKNKPK